RPLVSPGPAVPVGARHLVTSRPAISAVRGPAPCPSCRARSRPPAPPGHRAGRPCAVSHLLACALTALAALGRPAVLAGPRRCALRLASELTALAPPDGPAVLARRRLAVGRVGAFRTRIPSLQGQPTGLKRPRRLSVSASSRRTRSRSPSGRSAPSQGARTAGSSS